MSDAHRLVAEVALALAVLAVAWSAWLAFTGRPPGRFFVVNLAWTAIAVGGAAILGVVLLATGQGPRDPLHLVYGALGLVAVPALTVIVSRRPARQQAGVMLVGIVVLLILLLRLFQTGA